MVREPLRQSKEDLSRAKDTFERIHEIVVLYSSPFFNRYEFRLSTVETLAFVRHASGRSKD